MRRKILYVFFEISYILGMAYFVLQRNYGELPLIAFCSVFTIIMYLLVSREIKPVDDGIYVTLCGFVFMASFLGSSLGFYDLIPFYDDFLHLWSGIICAQIGFVVFRHLCNPNEKVNPKQRLFILLFILFFCMGCAALWEVFEFASDKISGTNMQSGGLEDTCIDMIDALLGCAVTLPYINHLINKTINK